MKCSSLGLVRAESSHASTLLCGLEPNLLRATASLGHLLRHDKLEDTHFLGDVFTWEGMIVFLTIKIHVLIITFFQ